MQRMSRNKIFKPKSGSMVKKKKKKKNLTCQAEGAVSIPGSGRSPGEGNGNPLQYSCRENSWTEKPGGLQSMGCKELDMT